jgi:lipopolysaccharide transport system permease protein
LPRRIPGSHFARNLVTRRTLILQLVKRDFEARYVGSGAGWLWGLVHPLVLIATYYFIFSVCLKTQMEPNEVTTSYAMFVFTGMLPWLLFQETVTRSASSMLEQANLITKTVFPAEIVPVSIFLSSLLNHLMALLMAIAGGIVSLHHLSPLVALLPLYIVLLGMLAVGIGWIAAALQVYVRDTSQVLSVILTLWFWATPIFIPERKMIAAGRWVGIIVKANPLTYFVRSYREAILGYRIPLMLHWAAMAAVVALAVFVSGGLFFRYMKRGFADVL